MKFSIYFEKIVEKIYRQKKNIDKWFNQKFDEFPPPFYCSVDIRLSNFKSSSVDINLFPSGFNNLKSRDLKNLFKLEIESRAPDAKNVSIFTEDFDRNSYYSKNVETLKSSISEAGYNVDAGVFNKKYKVKEKFIYNDEGNISDFIVFNNDFSNSKVTKLYQANTPFSGPIDLGWHKRKKSNFFSISDSIVRKFCADFNIHDNWFLNPEFRNCVTVDFLSQSGIECVAQHVDDILAKIKNKYDQYDISEKPFVVVKPDSGTFGMGIMSAYDSDTIKSLNRKQRTKMSSAKSQHNKKVVIQEGVPTMIKSPKGYTAELVFYFIGRHLAGSFYRSHPSCHQQENLNRKGMSFEASEDETSKIYYIQHLSARLALLTAAYEVYFCNQASQI